jgi:hypothetical protein
VSTDLSVALIGAVATVAVALAGGLVTLYAPDLKARWERERQVSELEARYSDSLLRSADALQSRFWNIVNGHFSAVYVQYGTDEERFYAITSTLWLVGQYFCWVELLRRDVHSLALGGVDRGRKLQTLLGQVEDCFATDVFDRRFRLWRAEQSALAELMIVERAADHARLECLGYASFVLKLENDKFKRWFGPLEAALADVESRDSTPPKRLAHLQNALLDLVEFLHGGERLDRKRLELET